jgi:hypothetical protein
MAHTDQHPISTPYLLRFPSTAQHSTQASAQADEKENVAMNTSRDFIPSAPVQDHLKDPQVRMNHGADVKLRYAHNRINFVSSRFFGVA